MTELYFNPRNGRITDETGKTYELGEARRLWRQIVANGEWLDTNLAFARLVRNEFDVTATLAEYKD